ncbi:hypothetical protein FLCU109888_08565 [Flavobacterium cucumis]|uniref:Uncharacterized protein n=1 Tax=Flavobacterium cucumis TaxID=416016 RepID=A0A1M7ZYA5_9FLAO|nr:hypothetical protein [Flavobacterium cucumis]SHO73851.1 hypothetical protein SAMN05443547_2226 [Flavobacterium cucumis]
MKNSKNSFTEAAHSLDIIDKMYMRWNCKWPKFMSFDQTVSWFKEKELIKQSIWNEILSSPGKLHIRFDGFESGNGVIFFDDIVHFFENGNQVKSAFRINQSLLLGFDVYHQEPSITRDKIKKLGIDLSKQYEIEDEEGRLNLVIGTTDSLDVKSPQFWIDKDALYLTRVIVDHDKHTDIFFKNYEMIANFPVATKIIFEIDNELAMVEEYFNIRFLEDIDEAIFLQDNFEKVRW